MVTVINGLSYILVSPNPEKNQQIQVVMKQVQRGKCRYELFNNLGQQILKADWLHEGGSRVFNILPADQLPPGIFKLSIAGTSLKRTVLSVVVTE